MLLLLSLTLLQSATPTGAVAPPRLTDTLVREIERALVSAAATAREKIESALSSPREPHWELQELRARVWQQSAPAEWQRKLERWQREQPDSPWPWALQALAGNWKERSEAAAEALRRDRGFAPALRLEIALALEAGNLAAARRLWGALPPGNSAPRLELEARLLVAEERPLEAQARLQGVTSARVSTAILRVQLHLANAAPVAAETALLQLRYLAPQRLETHELGVSLAIHKNDAAEVGTRSQAARVHFPDHEVFLYWQCHALAELKEWQSLSNALQEDLPLWQRMPAQQAYFCGMLAWERNAVAALRSAANDLRAALMVSATSPRRTASILTLPGLNREQHLAFEGRLASLQGDDETLLHIAQQIPQDHELAQLARTVERGRERRSSRRNFLLIIATLAVVAVAIAFKVRKRPQR